VKLDDVCSSFRAEEFPAVGVFDHPERSSVMTARSVIAAAVADDSFLVDCLRRELSLLESETRRDGLVPFFVIPDLGIRLAFGYWPPGGTPGPHEHTAWTITAVCRNMLEVVTFDRGASYRGRRLVIKNRFHAPAGRSGFIYDPSIHQPINTTSDWALSLHVSSPRDGEALHDFDQPLDALVAARKPAPAAGNHPYGAVVAARRQYTAVHQLARVLAEMHHPEADELLAQCAQLGPARTRNLVDRHTGRTRPNVQWILERVHPDLVLSHRQQGDLLALCVETPAGGTADALTMSNVAREAIIFAAAMERFDIRALPGKISNPERAEIAEALESSGLFRRINP
jgi:hypothetical protein